MRGGSECLATAVDIIGKFPILQFRLRQQQQFRRSRAAPVGLADSRTLRAEWGSAKSDALISAFVRDPAGRQFRDFCPIERKTGCRLPPSVDEQIPETRLAAFSPTYQETNLI